MKSENDKDLDLIAGRKAILTFLDLSDFNSVLRRHRDEGMPLAKIGGRWEMSRNAYKTWKDKIYSSPFEVNPDADLILGQKNILTFLGLSNFRAVLKCRDEEGMPLVKIGGRWEMSKRAYHAWKRKTYLSPEIEQRQAV